MYAAVGPVCAVVRYAVQGLYQRVHIQPKEHVLTQATRQPKELVFDRTDRTAPIG